MSIATDFKVCADGKSFPRSIGTFLLNPCFHSVALFRFSAALYRIRLEPLAKVVWYINRVIYSVDLDYRARLAPGFKLTHGLCVVVGAGVVSEGPLTLYQGVTIGGLYGSVRDNTKRGGVFSQPHFGKGVVVYTNACIFGPVYIGDDAIVKAGRLVIKDVAPGEKI